jgi:uncharacterized Zn-binding protein involved in type VI secretion
VRDKGSHQFYKRVGGENLESCVPPPTQPWAIIAGSLTVLMNVLPATRLGDTIVEALEPPNKILGGCATVLIGG